MYMFYHNDLQDRMIKEQKRHKTMDIIYQSTTCSQGQSQLQNVHVLENKSLISV